MRNVLVLGAVLLAACGGTIMDTGDEEQEILPEETPPPPATGGSPGSGGARPSTDAGSAGKGGAARAGSTGAGGTKPATGGSTAAGGTPGTGGAPPSSCTNPTDVVTGHGTWYGATGPSGACGIPYTKYKYYGAMNQEDFRDSAVCGACVNVTYKGKSLDVYIVDLCPVQGNEQWCYNGGHHIDFGPDAFGYFLPTAQGILDVITWKYTPCKVTGGITYTWKAESSEYWAELLIGNFPYEIAKVECNVGGSWAALMRTSYGYYQAPGGLGPAPYTFRITDINGSVVTDTNVPLDPGNTYQAQDNFGLCSQ